MSGTFEEMFNEWHAKAAERGHVLKRNDYDGGVDDFAGVSEGFHNGPRCTRCGETWCMHCTSPDQIESCEGDTLAPREAEREKAERIRDAASELLEALIGIMKHGTAWPGFMNESPRVKAAFAAIAKASPPPPPTPGPSPSLTGGGDD